jgi:hypothetical protein
MAGTGIPDSVTLSGPAAGNLAAPVIDPDAGTMRSDP